MSKKDYENIAATIKLQLKGWPDSGSVAVGARMGIRNTAVGLAYRFRENNPRFNRDKFLTACGICPTCSGGLMQSEVCPDCG